MNVSIWFEFKERSNQPIMAVKCWPQLFAIWMFWHKMDWSHSNSSNRTKDSSKTLKKIKCKKIWEIWTCNEYEIIRILKKEIVVTEYGFNVLLNDFMFLYWRINILTKNIIIVNALPNLIEFHREFFGRFIWVC